MFGETVEHIWHDVLKCSPQCLGILVLAERTSSERKSRRLCDGMLPSPAPRPLSNENTQQQIPGQIADSRLPIQSITLAAKCNNMMPSPHTAILTKEAKLWNVEVISPPPSPISEKHCFCGFCRHPSTGPGPFWSSLALSIMGLSGGTDMA